VETGRLYLNRQVTAIAALGECSREELDELARRRRGTTTRQLLEMLGLEPALVPACAGHLDARLDEGTRLEHTLDALCDDEALRLRIVDRARVLRDRVVRLVERHGDGEAIVLADLGWGASIQRRLARVLGLAGLRTRVDGLYLLTHAGAAETVASGGRVSGFLASLGHPGVVSDAVLRSPEVIEQVCMAAQGTQTGLDEELEPVLAELRVPSAQLAEAAAVRDGIRAFQRLYLRYRSAVPARLESISSRPEQLAPILARACVDPTAAEAARFAAWRHEDGMGCERTEALAGGRLLDRARHLAPEQVRETAFADSYWPSALVRLHDPHAADLVAAQAAGLVGADACSSRLETGTMVIEASAGLAIDTASRVEIVPRRNRHGLSFVEAKLRGGHIERVQIRLGTRPALVRIDKLELTLHVKDSPEPLSVRLESPECAEMLDTVNVDRISGRLLAGWADHGFVSFATGHVAGSRTVYRVDVELMFMGLTWDAETAPWKSGAREEPRRLTGTRIGARLRGAGGLLRR
jgi:hypothetical protein